MNRPTELKTDSLSKCVAEISDQTLMLFHSFTPYVCYTLALALVVEKADKSLCKGQNVLFRLHIIRWIPFSGAL